MSDTKTTDTVQVPCTRCGGSGTYPSSLAGGRCLPLYGGCGGTGTKTTTPAKIKANARARERAAEKREAARIAREQEQQETWREWGWTAEDLRDQLGYSITDARAILDVAWDGHR